MEFKFDDPDLEEAYFDPKRSVGHGPAVDKGFRKVIELINAANTELDLRALKGLHYHQLEGDRSHQHALNINKQWRVVVERVQLDKGIRLVIVSVEDYH